MAVIYDIITLESTVKTFLDLYLEDEKELRKKVLGMQLGTLVTIIMPLILGTEGYKELQDEIIEDITLRNKIIHKHKDELGISNDRSRMVIDNINKYMIFLGEKIKNLTDS